ncbi:hypothetical protein KDC22_17240 [Paenibacillus tritici]|uniref:hypothetical protein n=1 Tax=Paenibacillus tritici TaxID=1873425 RepID=UPI001BABAA79|nr:hypothetical protein [Paenibacillus tritici]QUL52216.1 hypothetical protein KDC22_17240 [Paenibacillus tritici]
MTMKSLFEIDSSDFNSQYGVPLDKDYIKQEVCSVNNNKITIRKIIESGMEYSESTESIFDQKDVAEVIISNIEIQFALYQFYVFYNGIENKEDISKTKLTYELCYPKEESKLNHMILINLLSVFDSVNVVYKKDKTIVVATLSSFETKMKIYDIYKRLYKESLLNPFIISFINEKEINKLDYVGASTSIYQYQPCEDELNAIVLNKKEMIFIHFIDQQLALSNYFLFYCVGWNDYDIAMSMTLKKLAKYFRKIFFTSTPDQFLSQLLMIYKA